MYGSKEEVLVFLVSEWRHGLGCGPRSFLSSNLAAQPEHSVQEKDVFLIHCICKMYLSVPVHSVHERDVFVTFAKSIYQWLKCIVKCIDFHWEKKLLNSSINYVYPCFYQKKLFWYDIHVYNVKNTMYFTAGLNGLGSQ